MNRGRQTFDYATYNVYGGESRKVLRSVVRRAPLPPRLPHKASPEGRYVTRETGEMSVVAFMRGRAWAAQLKAAGQWPKE